MAFGEFGRKVSGECPEGLHFCDLMMAEVIVTRICVYLLGIFVFRGGRQCEY